MMTKRPHKIIRFILLIVALFLLISNATYAAQEAKKLGDLNGDGVVNSIDAMRIINHITATRSEKIRKLYPNWILTESELKVADINNDGAVNAIDAMKIINYMTAKRSEKIAKQYQNG